MPATVTLVFLAIASPAPAVDVGVMNPVQHEDASPEPWWSVGVGPTLSIDEETTNLRLGLRATVDYLLNDDWALIVSLGGAASGSELGDTSSSAYSLQAGLGLRHVLLEVDPISVSMSAEVGGAHQHSWVSTGVASWNTSFRTVVGVALDLHVANNVELRLASNFLSASYGYSEHSEGPASENWSAAMFLEPSVLVLVSF